MFACLGLTAIGECAYNPAAPATIYFSLGEAVGALAFTLAAQQLLRPVYRFRLVVRYLRLSRVYALVFAGTGAALIASLVPSFPFLHSGPWGYAIVWEILGASLFALAYGAVVLAIVRPIRCAPSRISTFASGVATILSAPNETDHLDVAADVFESLPTLITTAGFLENNLQTSAFFDFTHRVAFAEYPYAVSLLGIIADPYFCETLVKRAPWKLAEALRAISAQKLYAESAEPFIHEIARQAIIRDESILAQEIDYRGFGNAPLLSEALFSDPFIVIHYNPLASCSRAWGGKITAAVLKRFNDATKRCYLVLIERGAIQRSQTAYSARDFYRYLFSVIDKLQEDANPEYELIFEINQAVAQAGKLAMKLMASVSPQEYDALFVSDAAGYRNDLLESLADIVYDALASAANAFEGADDRFWSLSTNVMHDMFNSIGAEPDGFTPFQQRLALRLTKRLKENTRGYYPAISRILLTTVGPYRHAAEQPNKTAFNLLRDAVYIQMKLFQKLAVREPEKVSHYLPKSISYNRRSNEITHKWRSGSTASTKLGDLRLPALSLVNSRWRRSLTEDESHASRQDYFI